MGDSVRVLSDANGSLHPAVLFVGEAPGRLGADKTAVPFHGDVAGDNFERLLQACGIRRSHIFVTNAALCNPRDDRGNNSTPTDQEIRNCSEHLRSQIDLLDPKVVVTLGARALAAVSVIEKHALSLGSDVSKPSQWYRRTLIPLYHPGARAMIHRPFGQQLLDYAMLAKILPHQQPADLNPMDLVAIIMRNVPARISYFALHKLVYLIEAKAVRELGHRLTDSYIIRQQNGPYVTDLHIRKLLKFFPWLRARTINGSLFLEGDPKTHTLQLFEPSSPEVAFEDFIVAIVAKYSSLSDPQLKTASYMTQQMREILREEKRTGKQLNRPLLA